MRMTGGLPIPNFFPNNLTREKKKIKWIIPFQNLFNTVIDINTLSINTRD